MQPFLDAWKKAGAKGLKIYEPGSEGPEEANELLERDGRNWRKLDLTMAGDDQRKVIRVADPAALATAAAERLLARIDANRGRAAICLTGGSSPKQLYRLLATDRYRSRIPWDRVHWFIGDERFVAPNDPLNNMGMARQIFLDRYAPAANIHPIPTDTVDPEESARGATSANCKSFYGARELDPARPLFDVVLMGVGPDGHTASLFPDDPAVEETARWVVGVPKAHVEPFVPRVTLTLPALGSCREMLFEVAGFGEARDLDASVRGREPAGESRALHGRDGLAGGSGGAWRRIFVSDEACEPPCALIVMGVSGSGKSTIAARLAERLDWTLRGRRPVSPREQRRQDERRPASHRRGSLALAAGDRR